MNTLTWNGASWFVSVEFALCLLFPIFLWLAEGQPFQLYGPVKGDEPQTLQDETLHMDVELYEGAAHFYEAIAEDFENGSKKQADALLRFLGKDASAR